MRETDALAVRGHGASRSSRTWLIRPNRESTTIVSRGSGISVMLWRTVRSGWAEAEVDDGTGGSDERPTAGRGAMPALQHRAPAGQLRVTCPVALLSVNRPPWKFWAVPVATAYVSEVG